MAMIQGMGYNPNMSMLSMVQNNKNGAAGGVASILTDRGNKSAQLADTMSTFGASSSAPGSVEVTSSFPGLGYSRGQMTRIPAYSEQTVEYDYLTKSNPEMTEKEYEAAIKKLAEKNAAAGITEDVGDDYFELARSFVSVVSPDRKAIIDGASSTALIPAKSNYDMVSAYDDDGNVVATYNPTKGWTNRFTETEKARNAQFDSIYWDAYNAYVKANKLPATEDSEKVENAVVGDQEEEKPTTVDVSA